MHFSNPSNITLAAMVYKVPKKKLKLNINGWVMANKGDTLERVR